jgi:hypothetical protein
LHYKAKNFAYYPAFYPRNLRIHICIRVGYARVVHWWDLPKALDSQRSLVGVPDVRDSNTISLEVERVNQQLGLHIDENTCLTDWDGSQADYNHIVGGLM